MDTRAISFKTFFLDKVGILLNRADVLTKQLSAKEMHKHLTAIGHIMAGGRAKTAKRMLGEGQPLRPNNGLAEEE